MIYLSKASLDNFPLLFFLFKGHSHPLMFCLSHYNSFWYITWNPLCFHFPIRNKKDEKQFHTNIRLFLCQWSVWAHDVEWAFWPISSQEKTFRGGLYCFYKMFPVNRATCDVAVDHTAQPLQADTLKPNQFLFWARLITWGRWKSRHVLTHKPIESYQTHIDFFNVFKMRWCSLTFCFSSHLGTKFIKIIIFIFRSLSSSKTPVEWPQLVPQ